MSYYRVSSGSSINGIDLLENDGMNILEGGVATSTTVNSGGILTVESGGLASETTVYSSGIFTVKFGGFATGTTVNSGGHFLADSGAAVTDTTVNSGGLFGIYSGSTATDTTFNSGGRLIIFDKGKVTGKLTLHKGATVDPHPGAILDFDLTQTAPGADALVNDLSIVLSHPFSYTLTVTDRQGDGTYNLAEVAAGFDKTITVANTSGTTLGTLTVGGGTKTFGKRKYTLNLDSSCLAVTVDIIPDVTGDLTLGTIYHLTDGMVGSGVNVQDHAALAVSSGCLASMTTVSRGGHLFVFSGGVANTTVTSGGVHISSGGTANSTTVNSGGTMSVNGTADSTSITGEARMFLYSGGTAINTLVNSSGMFEVSSGCTASNTTISSNGSMIVFGSGAASSTTVNFGGTISVNGTADNTSVSGEGRMFLYSGGTASNTTVSSGGRMTVFDGGKLSGRMTFAPGANVDIREGAVIDFNLPQTGPGADALINDFMFVGGNPSFTLTVDSTLPSGQYRLADMVEAFSKTITVTDTSGATLGTLSVADDTVDIGDMTYTLTLNGGSLGVTIAPRVLTGDLDSAYNLLSGRFASSVNILNGGELFVDHNAMGDDITVNSGGKMVVSGGGTINNVAVGSDGLISMSSGAKLTGKMTFEWGAMLSAEAGAIVDFDLTKTIVGPTADPLLSRIAPALGTKCTFTLTVSGSEADGNYKIAGGAAQIGDRAITVVNTSGVELGTLTVAGGTTTIDGRDYTLTLNRGNLGVTIGELVPVYELAGDLSSSRDLYSGERASSVNILSGGELVIRGGFASQTTVNSGGVLVVPLAGSASVVSAASGAMVYVQMGGYASGIVAEEGAFVNLTAAPNTYVQGTYAGSAFEITDTVSGFTLPSSCEFEVFSGTAIDMTVEPIASLYIDRGAKANGIAVTSGGCLFVVNGGSATGIVAEEGAHLIFVVEPGNYAKGTYAGSAFEIGDTVSGYNTHAGRINVTENGKADAVTVSQDGFLSVFSGGTATRIIENGGNVTFENGADVSFASHTFSGVSISAGRNVTVHSGTTATDTTVNRNGNLTVYEGGLAINTVVSSGGGLRISSDGKLTGKMTFENEARVSATAGAIVDFDLTQTTAGADALLNDMSAIQIEGDAPVYTLTVSGTEAAGDYRLADGAAGFTGTISVVSTAGAALGTLSLNDAATIGGVDYTLTLNGASLSVTVGSAPGPQPAAGPDFFTGDFDGDGKAMLATQKDGAVKIYSNGAEWGSGLALDPGWEVVGVGDFNADKKDDFLRVNTEGYVVGEMSQGGGTFAAQVLNLKSAGWSILGTGDFNGNGSDDVLIANPTAASETVGLLGYWESGVTWTLINGYSAEWKMVSTGDFNGDGKCDMLWKNEFIGAGDLTYNAYCTWIVEDPVDWRMVSVANPSEWKFLCSGDFDGNGSHDIAMINDVGVVGIWGVNDGYLSSWSILSAVTPEWTLAGVGDFNGDGTDDIAWSNTDTGLTGYWQINNKELTAWSNLATIG